MTVTNSLRACVMEMSCSAMSCRGWNGDVIENGVCVAEGSVLGVADVMSLCGVRDVE